MASFNTISIRFNADLKQFSSQMQNAQRQMQKYGRQMQDIGAGLTLGVTLPVLGLGAAAVKAASDAEETSSKFNTVFRDISDAANKASEELRNSYGLSGQASKQLLSDTGDLLTGFGFTQESALDLSTEVNKLAVDLASFTNFSGGAEGASQALTKALLGERESVKSLGIAILESDVQQRVLENTQKGLTFETERQAKAYATLQIAQEQSKNAIGDYARTSGSFANQVRLLKARVNDLAVEFGEILLPYVNKLAGFVSGLVERFSNLDGSTKKIIVVVGLLAAALGPVLLILGTLLTMLPALGTAFTVLTGPVGLVIAAIAGIAVVVYKNWDKIMKYVNELTNYFIDLYNESVIFRVAVEQIIFTFKTLWEVVKLVFGAIYDAVKNTGSFIVDIFKNAGGIIKAVLTGSFEEIPKIIAKQTSLLAKNFQDNIQDLSGRVSEFTDNVKNNFNDAIDSVTQRKKIAFVKENVDASAIQEKVAEAVAAGLSGGGRGKTEGVNSLTSGEVIQAKSPLDEVSEKMPIQVANISEQQELFVANAVTFNEKLSEIVNNTAQNFVAGFGQMIGAMAAGNVSAADIGKLLIGTFADMATQVGKMAIGIGLAVTGIKKALQSLNPAVAIAAGIALVALGTFARSALGKIGNGGKADMPAFADGGLVYGPTVGLMGEYSGARNNPEVIAPLNKLKDLIGGGNAQRVEVVGVLKGTDMHLQNARTQNYLNRRG